MSFQSSFHQPPFNYPIFSSQQHFYVGPSNSFATSTMTPPSTYNPMSFMQYYQSEDNEVEDTNDDIPPPLLPTVPSEQQPQGGLRRRPPCGTASHK